MSTVQKLSREQFMAQLKKVPLTKSNQVLLKTLIQANGQKTTEEIASAYSALTKKRHKVASITTQISQMRKQFKEAGIEFPKSWDVKREGGGGRKSERVDAATLLEGLIGDDFDLSGVDMVESEAVEDKDNEAASE